MTSIPVGRREQVILQQVRDRERGSRTSSSQGLTFPWSVVVHGVVHDGERSLDQSDRTSTRRRVLPTPHQFTFQPERLGRVPHAGPPTHQDHEDQCQLTFLLLPFLLTTPSLFTALTSLSLANSICPFPFGIFSAGRRRKTSRQYRLFRITPLRFP